MAASPGVVLVGDASDRRGGHGGHGYYLDPILSAVNHLKQSAQMAAPLTASPQWVISDTCGLTDRVLRLGYRVAGSSTSTPPTARRERQESGARRGRGGRQYRSMMRTERHPLYTDLLGELDDR